MIAIGVRCDCGWGPQDVVPLEGALNYLLNLAFMLGQHQSTCETFDEVCTCGHKHYLNKGARRRIRACHYCPCRREQPVREGTASA